MQCAQVILAGDSEATLQGNAGLPRAMQVLREVAITGRSQRERDVLCQLTLSIHAIYFQSFRRRGRKAGGTAYFVLEKKSLWPVVAQNLKAESCALSLSQCRAAAMSKSRESRLVLLGFFSHHHDRKGQE